MRVCVCVCVYTCHFYYTARLIICGAAAQRIAQYLYIEYSKYRSDEDQVRPDSIRQHATKGSRGQSRFD